MLVLITLTVLMREIVMSDHTHYFLLSAGSNNDTRQVTKQVHNFVQFRCQRDPAVLCAFALRVVFVCCRVGVARPGTHSEALITQNDNHALSPLMTVWGT